MNPDQLFLFILLIHFLADFGLQTHDQAMNKSTSVKWLLYHVGVYSLVWFFAALFYFDSFEKALVFSTITFVAHFATDYMTSRIGKPFWEAKNLHDGFVVVGFDQVLHYVQLYYTFKMLL